MANTTADKTPISLDNLARNNERMKEYIQSEIDKIPTGGSITIDDTLSDTSENPVQNKVINTALSEKADSSHTHTKSEIADFPTSLPARDVYDWAKQPTKPTYTASEVGADASGSANTALTEAKAYTDTEIAGLINGAPTTLDTLGEIADAMKSNQTVIEALNTAIGTKANTSDLTAHTGNTSNPHSVTKTQVGLGNVPNVTTNDQTPSYTESSSLTKLTSGEKLSVAFGKVSKAVTDLIAHIADSVIHITSAERTNWNAAKTHADSAHAPSNAQANVIETVKVNGTALTPSSKGVDITVPTVGNGTITIKQAGTTKGTFTTNQSGNTTIELTDNNTTYSAMTGATSSAAGTSGLVPAPSKGDEIKFLRGDGTWVTPEKLASSSHTTVTIDTSDWTANPDGGYMYTYTLPNKIPYLNFNFDVKLSTDQSAAKLQIEAWNCIIADGDITQNWEGLVGTDGISYFYTTAFTFYAFTTRPSVTLTVGIQGVS